MAEEKSPQISTSDVYTEAQTTSELELSESTTQAGKFKAILQVLLKFIGVSDLNNLRISLPSQLLDPISNLEYWTYTDCPQTLSAIRSETDSLQRMLQVVKFWFSKDARFINNKIVKPFNSLLGEQFICRYEFDDNVVYSLAEQISHHPPVSAYYQFDPKHQIVARGVDQIAAKFTGTSLKISPGPLNKGIFVSLLPLNDQPLEEYQLSHPTAQINGVLTFNLWISVTGYCVIKCEDTGLVCLIKYLDESFFGKAKFAIDGVVVKHVFTPESSSDEQIISMYTKKNGNLNVKDPLCTLSGSWREKVYCQIGPDSTLLIDLSETPMASELSDAQIKKIVQPIEQQGEFESRRLWQPVIDNMLKGSFGEATSQKRQLENAQRTRIKAMKDQYQSVWFGFKDSEDVGGSSKEVDVNGKVAVGKPFLVQEVVKPWST